jgi:hypothetical protein
MALATAGRILYPDPTLQFALRAISSSSDFQINGTGHRYGWVFQVPQSGTITKAGIRIHTCASAVTSRLGLYTVDSSGNPTSTLYGSGNYGTFTPSANTYSEVTLGTAATATAGDFVALVVEFDSTAGDMFVSGANGTYTLHAIGYSAKNSGSWAKSTTGAPIMAHVYYSDSGGIWPYIGCGPFTGVAATATFNLNTSLDTSGHNADEHALKITVPFKCRVAGIWHNFAAASGADHEAILYSGTTAQQTLALDGDFAASTSINGVRSCLFATGQSVDAGATVRAAIRATTATNLTYRRMPLFAAGSEQSLGIPQGTCLSYRSDAGSNAWNDSTTNLPMIGLIIDQLDDGAGGSGVTRRLAKVLGI